MENRIGKQVFIKNAIHRTYPNNNFCTTTMEDIEAAISSIYDEKVSAAAEHAVESWRFYYLIQGHSDKALNEILLVRGFGGTLKYILTKKLNDAAAAILRPLKTYQYTKALKNLKNNKYNGET